MNCAFAIRDSIAALATSKASRLRVAELSIVSILDGEIGDPITWIDQPDDDGPARCGPARAAEPFRAVAEDIAAHLPTGAVLLDRPNSTLALLARVQPKWRPALVVDALSLATYARTPAGHRHGAGELAAVRSAEIPRGASAERAVATARLLLSLLDMPEILRLI